MHFFRNSWTIVLHINFCAAQSPAQSDFQRPFIAPGLGTIVEKIDEYLLHLALVHLELADGLQVCVYDNLALVYRTEEFDGVADNVVKGGRFGPELSACKLAQLLYYSVSSFDSFPAL